MKYNGHIRNLLQGISQQTAKERRPEQLERQVNCSSSIIDGLGKRPGTRGIGVYDTVEFPSGDDTAFYSYDRGDTNERYLIGAGTDTITVVDLLTGNTVPVVYDVPSTYLNSTKPSEALKFHTIADTTFVVNKEKIVTTQNPSTSADAWQALIYCKRANWGKDYKILVGGAVIATYTTPAVITLDTTATSADVNKAATLKTTDVIEGLLAGGLSTWASANGVSVTQIEDVIHLTKATGTYSMSSSDDTNGTDLYVIGEIYETYAGLPDFAPNGYKVKISGVDKDKLSDYYVTFETDLGTVAGRGAWVEDIGFGVDQDLSPATMPHILVREADAKFYFRQIAWDSRKAGDDDTNPKPSFVGNTIQDVISYQGRLVLTTKENQCASVTFEFYNFWANSVRVEAADDPIDTASNDNQVTNIHHTLVFNSALVSFSDRAQFVHPGTAAFTSKTFSLTSKIRYNNNVLCPPVASAKSVFFAYDYGLYTGIREIQTENITGNVDAEVPTEHCKKFVQGSARQLATSTDYNMLCVRTVENPTTLYVYEWFDKTGERLQSAWHEWDFGSEIMYMNIIQDKLYGILKRGSVYSLGYIDLANQDSPGCDFPVRLDLMEELTAVSTGDDWCITPTITDIPGVDINTLAVIAGADTQLPGTAVTSRVDGNTICISKATVQSPSIPKFLVGLPYLAEAEVTNPYIRDAEGNAKAHGTLKLSIMHFNLSDTGYLEIEVSADHGSYTHVYNTRIIDGTAFVLDGPPALLDAQLTIPVRESRDKCKITIKSDSHLPFFVSDVDWSGVYYESGRRTI